jgi:hypothetical protein
MKARVLIILGFYLGVVASFGQVASLPSPGMQAYCFGPSLAWIPMATGAGGAPSSYRMQQVPLYGQNGSSNVPIKCDSSGNLITGGAVGGDLSGNLPNPTVAKINGIAVPASFAGFHGNSSGVRIPLATNWANTTQGILCDDGNGNIAICTTAKEGGYVVPVLLGTLTAGHIVTWYNAANGIQDGGGLYAAALTTTAAASDNVTVTGMAAGGHCQLTPTNATGATNLATTYVSAKTTNQITVTHTATSGMTFDILCTTF